MNDLNMLMTRDLKHLRNEISCYENEDALWTKEAQIANSAGNLALHICGNLKHFVGAVLNHSGYVRDREFEFAGRVNKADLIQNIEETLNAVESYFDSSNSEILDQTYPLKVFGYEMTNFYFLVHLHGHLNYHLGQINYHRRILGVN
jgi:uncharacterized damage-inducible protein DinB